MSFNRYVALVRADLHRVTGSATIANFVKYALAGIGFKYMFWLRTASYASQPGGLQRVVRPIARFMHRRLTIRFGISIPITTSIGEGLYIGHFGGIVVNASAVLGSNCNLSHGVTIGQTNRGPRSGVPTIGDRVYFAPGAKVVGAVTVSNDAVVGPNAVVVDDVANSTVVGGSPARTLSDEGSSGYVNNLS